MRMIRVKTDLVMTVHEYPSGTYAEQDERLRQLIGNGCRTYEHVKPNRLYTELHMVRDVSSKPGACVCMLVDEEGRLKENEVNLLGSWLYGADMHGDPIMGNVLFVGEEWVGNGIGFCGIDEMMFHYLEKQLFYLIAKMRVAKEAKRI